MKRLAVPLLCVWALLEPPYKNNVAPILNAPFKDWKIASFVRDKISIPYYFDTLKDCEDRRKGLGLGNEKVCLPVNPVLTGSGN
jgi:hypothetical protein